ncbi:MAG: hypothetical protein JNL11_11975 [Bdellovibrionaceae bacterium]|nr:hypothetical protein [Pseudobdellovibrionaceae bacterium]
MKTVSSLLVLVLSAVAMAQQPSQIVINVDRQDFNPIQQADWRVLAGSTSLAKEYRGETSAGVGLGIGIERMISQRWSVGAQYANVNAMTSGSQGILLTDENGNQYYDRYERKENINMFNAYGKFNFVNYPVNKWNLIQVSLLGGLMGYDRSTQAVNVIYGAAASYNYDNLIGFELSTKVNLEARSSTSASLVGYF